MLLEMLSLASTAALLLAAGGCAYWYAHLSPIYRHLSAYVWMLCAMNGLAYFFGHLGYNLFLLPLTSLLTWVIVVQLYRSVIPSALLTLLSLGIVGVFLWECLALSKLFEVAHFQPFSLALTDLSLVGLGLYTFVASLRAPRMTEHYALLPLNTLLVVYFFLHGILFLSINFLINTSMVLTLPFWALYAVASILFYLSILLVTWQHGKTQRTSLAG